MTNPIIIDGALADGEKTRILNERVETYSDELSDLLWPNWAPHKGTIAIEPLANLSGVYQKGLVNTIVVAIPKAAKGKIEITTVQGSDSKWRGESCLVTGDCGFYSSPSINSKVFDSEDLAIKHQISEVTKSIHLREQHEHDPRKRVNISKVIKAFDKWCDEYSGAEYGQLVLF